MINPRTRKSAAIKPRKPRTTSIRQRRLIPAAPEEVYDAFVNAQKHTEFTGAKATCDAKVGGRFTAWDGYITGRNLELKPGKSIVQEWTTTEWPDGSPPSRVEFTFARKGAATEVAMVHSNVPASQAGSYREGWTAYYWKPLKEYFQKKKS